ncbi:hypothetical protein [Streptomyces sp. NPDC005538]|uniref:hypothetical protein n=1 Tax=Streptomyces sp. NPDC005538 TaxID=3157043 RepID=UPI0033B41D98
MNVVFARALETCRYHPALPGTHFQWEAWDAQDNFFFLRYKSGVGTVDALKDNDSWGQNEDDYDRVVQFDTGRRNESILSLDEFCQRAGIQLAPAARVVKLE